MNIYNKILQPQVWVTNVRRQSKTFLVFFKDIEKIAFQLVFLHVLSRGHAEPQYRMFRPILLYSLYKKSLKQVLPSLEIRLKRRYKQRLAEPSRAAQEDILAEVYHVPDILSLVYVKTVKVYHLRECLYAHGQSFQSFRFHIRKTIYVTMSFIRLQSYEKTLEFACLSRKKVINKELSY